MAHIRSTLDFDTRFQHIADAVKAFKKRWPDWTCSVEVPVGTTPEPYIAFTASSWSTGYARDVQEFCDEHDLRYTITPIGGRLAVTLTIIR
jgi:hypothetical protein